MFPAFSTFVYASSFRIVSFYNLFLFSFFLFCSTFAYFASFLCFPFFFLFFSYTLPLSLSSYLYLFSKSSFLRFSSLSFWFQLSTFRLFPTIPFSFLFCFSFFLLVSPTSLPSPASFHTLYLTSLRKCRDRFTLQEHWLHEFLYAADELKQTNNRSFYYPSLAHFPSSHVIHLSLYRLLLSTYTSSSFSSFSFIFPSLISLLL